MIGLTKLEQRNALFHYQEGVVLDLLAAVQAYQRSCSDEDRWKEVKRLVALMDRLLLEEWKLKHEKDPTP